MSRSCSRRHRFPAAAFPGADHGLVGARRGIGRAEAGIDLAAIHNRRKEVIVLDCLEIVVAQTDAGARVEAAMQSVIRPAKDRGKAVVAQLFVVDGMSAGCCGSDTMPIRGRKAAMSARPIEARRKVASDTPSSSTAAARQ